jgi:hypothetical protein
VWRFTHAIPVTQEDEEEDGEFEAHLGYIVRHCNKNKEQKIKQSTKLNRRRNNHITISLDHLRNVLFSRDL